MKRFRGGPRPALSDASTKALYDYWNALRNGRALPLRREVDPSAIRSLLPRIFMLEVVDAHHVIFRIAGTAICAAFGREFRDHNFIDVWNPTSRVDIVELLRRIACDHEAGLVRAEAATLDKSVVDCELLILPLKDANGATTRLIGVAGCQESLERLGWRKLVHLRALTSATFDPSETVVSFSGEESLRPPLAVVASPRPEARPRAVTPISSATGNSWRERLRLLLQLDE